METQESVLARIAGIVGASHVLTVAEEMQPYLSEWRGYYHGRSPAVVRPGSAEEISAILRLANETGTPIVPQGGNTGLVGGQIPDESGREIVRLAGAARQDPRHRRGGRHHRSPRPAWCWSACRRRLRRPACCSRCRSARRAPAASAATSRPTPAAPTCSPTATPGASSSAWRWCCRRARSGTASAAS